MTAPTGGTSGFFKRLWYSIKLIFIGLKWNIIELLTFHKKFDLQKVPRRPGEVAVITGGARGIGLEVIKKLLILDMHVVIGCRNESAANEMVEKFRKSGINTGTTEIINLDLMSLDSVREFGGKVLKKYLKIHVLLNNAGIMMTPYNLTKDKYESQFQVNYLSHFLLTNILLPRLIKTGRVGKASRIVNVSSAAHYGGEINFEDINMQQMYSKDMAYMSSKLMQVVNARDLHARLAKEGAHVNVYAVHPGVIMTDLYEHVFFAKCFGFFLKLIYKTPEQGADGVTFAAISSKFEGEGGLYFQNCKKYSVNRVAKDPELQKRLWEVSCHLTGWENVPMADVVKQAMKHGGQTVPIRNGKVIPGPGEISNGRKACETKKASKTDETLESSDVATNIVIDEDPFPQEPIPQDPESDSGSNTGSGSCSTITSDSDSIKTFHSSRSQTKKDLEIDPRQYLTSDSSVRTVISNRQEDSDKDKNDNGYNNDHGDNNDDPHTFTVTVTDTDDNTNQITTVTVQENAITLKVVSKNQEDLQIQELPDLTNVTTSTEGIFYANESTQSVLIQQSQSSSTYETTNNFNNDSNNNNNEIGQWTKDDNNYSYTTSDFTTGGTSDYSITIDSSSPATNDDYSAPSQD